MVGNVHEFAMLLFEHEPRLILFFLGADASGAADGARFVSAEFVHLDRARYRSPTQLRSDRAAVFPMLRLGAVVEMQNRFRRQKLRSWPPYLSQLWFREQVDQVALLVLCPDRAVAARYRQPIEMGYGNVISPIIIGPDQMPVITHPATARDLPQLAVLSALFHHDHPRDREIFVAFAAALEQVDPERGRTYYEIVFAELPASRQHQLQEVVMGALTMEYRSIYNRTLFTEGKAEGKVEGHAEGKVEGRTEGKVEGEVAALLAVLAAKHIDLTPADRARILACTDQAQLLTWLTRAATMAEAAAIDDLFADADADADAEAGTGTEAAS